MGYVVSKHSTATKARLVSSSTALVRHLETGTKPPNIPLCRSEEGAKSGGIFKRNPHQFKDQHFLLCHH